jgi:hypothetical protein
MASTRLDPIAQPQGLPVERLFQAASGYMISAALSVAAKLKIADLLADGPRSVADLAEATKSNEDGLYRVLRALVSAGFFTAPGPRTFALSPEVELLRSDVPGSIRPMVLWMANALHFEVWSEMSYSVETGKPAIDMLYGKPCFEALGGLPEVAREFNDAMTCFSGSLAPALLEAYDFTGTHTLMDVAGGHGYVLCEVLSRYPEMRGILFDMPGVVDGARSRIESLNLDGRCQTAAGDFFTEIPAGADAYYMQHIIHDWDDEPALTILRNCRQALDSHRNGTLLVMDNVIPETPQPHYGKLLDLEMMLMPGGRERTETEFHRLFAEAGFEIARIVPTRGSHSLIVAHPA